MKRILYFVIAVHLFTSTEVISSLVDYSFTITQKTVYFAGKKAQARCIGGVIPAPTIEATVGDTLRVTFTNLMDVETSIHWHGVLLPNDQDGVPYLTTPPIRPGKSFTYEYEVRVPGTYWYHSHTGLHEQQGMYGALVFHPREGERCRVDRDYVVVLSDWTHEKPSIVLGNLKGSGDYYTLKKRSVLSWDRVIERGCKAIYHRIKSAWNRMEAMDISDIGYDAFLSNGRENTYLKAHKGEVIRLRLINSGAGSYFNVEFSGGPLEIIAADGVDVEPIKVQRLRIAIAETYDVLIRIPEEKQYEVRATAEDGTGSSSTFLGKGEIVWAPDIPAPDLFLPMHDHMSSHDVHAEHEMHHEDHTLAYMDHYRALRSVKPTAFASDHVREMTLALTGNMERYTWSFDNKTLRETDNILITKGEVLRLHLDNKTMMHHPIHLHGHFFRVLNGHGDRAPLKHTVNVPAMGRATIEFEADASGDWFFHCHNLYHMMSGMSRVFSYEDSTTVTRGVIKELDHDRWYGAHDISLLSQMVSIQGTWSNTRNMIVLDLEHNYDKEYDIDIFYARNILPNLTRFLDVYVGANFCREGKETDSRNTLMVGVRYILPLYIYADIRIDTKKKILFEVGSDVQIAERLIFEWSYDTDKDYQVSLSYEISKTTLLQLVYDSDFKWGGGLRVFI